MKISNKVRAEAVEFAGCMATWWENDAGEVSQYDVEMSFSLCAVSLASAAHIAIDSSDEFAEHWMSIDGVASHYYSGALWAEAQAMLLDGWTP